MSAFRFLLCVTLTLFTASPLLAQADFEQAKQANWHQWRGPNADGMAGPGSNPPVTWSESENVAWKVRIDGEGSSTPIVWQDRVYLIAAVETNKSPKDPVIPHPESKTSPTGKIFEFQAVCLDRETGKEIWKKTLVSAAPHEGRHSSTTYASASPVTDGKNLYVSFGSYGIFCLTLDGQVVWQRDLGDMRTRRGWGEAVSPVLAGDQLIVMWDQEDQSRIFALQTRDGSTTWMSDRNEPTTWATPLVVKRDQRTQIVTAGTNQVRSYDLDRGELIWESEGLTLNAIPCPVLDEDHVILMSGYRGNKAVSLNLNGDDENEPEVTWELSHDTPYVPSPLLTQGRLYFTKSNNAILSCVNARTGKSVYGLQRLPELRSMYASPIATDSHLYFSSREGKTLVLKNSDRFEVVGTNTLDGGIDASPAVAGNQIFIRTKSHLYCIADQDSDGGTDAQPAQESVKPGINADFLDPNLDVDSFVERFEMESREVFANRLEILKQCGISTGANVADIGAGTGLFTRMFSRTVGAEGQVYAVDIAPNFLSHIRTQTTQLGIKNVTPVLCSEDSVSLAADSVDLVFVCDTYHHFEYPQSTVASIHKALRKNGRLVVIDFERIPGKSRPWLLNHVRAGKEVFRREIESAGFELVEEKKDIGLEENYFLLFKKK